MSDFDSGLIAYDYRDADIAEIGDVVNRIGEPIYAESLATLTTMVNAIIAQRCPRFSSSRVYGGDVEVSPPARYVRMRLSDRVVRLGVAFIGNFESPDASNNPSVVVSLHLVSDDSEIDSRTYLVDGEVPKIVLSDATQSFLEVYENQGEDVYLKAVATKGHIRWLAGHEIYGASRWLDLDTTFAAVPAPT